MILLVSLIIIITLGIVFYAIIKYRCPKRTNNVTEGLDTKIAQPVDMQATNNNVQYKTADYAGTFDGRFNGSIAIDDQYFYDKIFDNVVYYPNEYEAQANWNDVVATGWEKCQTDCQGHCVEYGITGNSYCFPY